MRTNKKHAHARFPTEGKIRESPLRRLEDFGFFISDPELNRYKSNAPVRGFSRLLINISPARTKSEMEYLMEGGKAHYWLDTSILIIPPVIYGEKDGRYFSIHEVSFLNAHACGLAAIDDQYNLMWKNAEEVKRVYHTILEGLIARDDVSIPTEMTDELEE